MSRLVLALLGLVSLVSGPVLADAAPEKAPEKKPESEKPAPIARTGPKKLFPVRIDTDCGRKLQLNGWGLCEWGIFSWDLYYASLHCERTSKSASKLTGSDQAYEIRLHFLRDLTRDQMRKAYRAGIEANAGKKLPDYKKRLDRLLGMMRAVEEGDDLVFRYLPGEGMTVSFDGKRAGKIEGADWAKLFLEVYVGPKAPTDDLRRGLLGR